MNDGNEKFIFIKSLQNKKTKERLKRLSYVSQIALKYGGNKTDFITEKNVYEAWEKGVVPPSVHSLQVAVSMQEIKLFIQHHVSYDDPIWNNDFIQGLFACTLRVRTLPCHSNAFDSVQWNSIPSIERIFTASPFGGRLIKRQLTLNSVEYSLLMVPALSLSYCEDSLSFMAGVMAAGNMCKYKKYNAARYPSRAKPYFEKWRIPFKQSWEHRHSILVCPIWPALMSIYMPESEQKEWLNVSKPWMTKIYAPFLWRLYVDSIFRKKGIPYLRSRRQVYYDFKLMFPEEKAMKALTRVGREDDLFSLDSRIGQTVVKWSQNAADTV